MNIINTITKDPFKFELMVSPEHGMIDIPHYDSFAKREVSENDVRLTDALRWSKIKTELSSRVGVFMTTYLDVPMLLFRRHNVESITRFVYTIETTPLFNKFPVVIYSDPHDNMIDVDHPGSNITKKTYARFDLFNYYESLQEDRIIKKIKTLEYYKENYELFDENINDHLSWVAVPYDVLCEGIIKLKLKYMKDFHLSVKDYINLI